MALATTHVTGTATGVDASSFTRSFTSDAATLYIAGISVQQGSSTNPSTPTVTHNSITATEIYSLLYVTTGTDRKKLWVFGWDSGAGSGSAVTWTADFGTSHIGFECTILAVTGSDMAHGLVQTFVQSGLTTPDATGTSGSVTLAAAGDANNRPYSFFAHAAAETQTAEAGWTAFTAQQHANPNAGFRGQWNDTTFDTTPSMSWTTSANYGGIGFELKAEVVPPPGTNPNLYVNVPPLRW